MSLFNKLRQKQAEQATSDLQAYFNFLAQVDIHNATDKQAEQLQSHMRAVGKSVEAVERDYQSIQDAKSHQQIVVETADVEARLDKATQAQQSAFAERQAQHHRCNQLVIEASNALHEATAMRDRRIASMRSLKETPPHILTAIEIAASTPSRARR